ncbi:MAG: aspartate aminotransferase family protein [Candidatus Phosphoribacter sp.]
MTQARLDALLGYDREHLWHPYSSALTPSEPYLVDSASGVRLRLRLPSGETRECIDAMSSWWCAIHGYAVRELDAAATAQLGRMSHVMFGGLTHEPAIELARRLVELAPRRRAVRPDDGPAAAPSASPAVGAADGPAAGPRDLDAGSPLQHVFFADSGSVSVEVAMKMALQVHVAEGQPRTRFFTIRGGYHGDTFSPMSVTDPVGGMHSLFRGILPEHVFAPLPPPAGGPQHALDAWESETRTLYAAHADSIAAVILEPILQGAGGMRFHDARVVQVLAELARGHGALVIFDEIATGFGRTGTLWAADACGVVPDIMCVGKALTGGYLTLAALLCTREVAERVSSGEAGGLMHGPTFMANPLACAVASASLDLLVRNDVHAQVAALEAGLEAGLEPARDLACVQDVRVRGAVGVIQLREPAHVRAVAAYAVEHGVWVRPFRDLVYTMPPYVTSVDDLATVTRVLVGAVRAVHG